MQMFMFIEVNGRMQECAILSVHGSWPADPNNVRVSLRTEDGQRLRMEVSRYGAFNDDGYIVNDLRAL